MHTRQGSLDGTQMLKAHKEVLDSEQKVIFIIRLLDHIASSQDQCASTIGVAIEVKSSGNAGESRIY